MANEDKSPDLNPSKARKVPGIAHPGASQNDAPAKPREIGGPKGPEPTRYGDWEVNGRCTDF